MFLGVQSSVLLESLPGSIEILNYNCQSGNWVPSLIREENGKLVHYEPEAQVAFAERTETVRSNCARCHGEDIHLNWFQYRFWPGAYGSYHLAGYQGVGEPTPNTYRDVPIWAIEQPMFSNFLKSVAAQTNTIYDFLKPKNIRWIWQASEANNAFTNTIFHLQSHRYAHRLLEDLPRANRESVIQTWKTLLTAIEVRSDPVWDEDFKTSAEFVINTICDANIIECADRALMVQDLMSTAAPSLKNGEEAVKSDSPTFLGLSKAVADAKWEIAEQGYRSLWAREPNITAAKNFIFDTKKHFWFQPAALSFFWKKLNKKGSFEELYSACKARHDKTPFPSGVFESSAASFSLEGMAPLGHVVQHLDKMLLNCN